MVSVKYVSEISWGLWYRIVTYEFAKVSYTLLNADVLNLFQFFAQQLLM